MFGAFQSKFALTSIEPKKNLIKRYVVCWFLSLDCCRDKTEHTQNKNLLSMGGNVFAFYKAYLL